MIYLQFLCPSLALYGIFKNQSENYFQFFILTVFGSYLQCIGVFLGYHRYFTHKSFECFSIIKYMLALLGCLSLQSGPIIWAEHHLYHHKHCDNIEKDIHTPYVKKSFWKKLWYIHFEYLLDKPKPLRNYRITLPNLRKDRTLFLINKYFWSVHFIGILFVSWLNANFYYAIYSICLPSCITWNAVHFTNSLCHMVGSRPVDLKNCKATNVWWLSFICLGDNWHANHHYKPSLANHGRTLYQIDLNYMIILFLEFIGVVWSVRKS